MHDGAMAVAVIASDCLSVCSAITGGCSGGDGGGDGDGDDDDSPPESIAKGSCCFLLFLRNVASKLWSRDSNSPLAVLLVFIHLKPQQIKLETRKLKIKTKVKRINF